MLVRQQVQTHTEWELLKWAILVALASAIALGILTSVAGAVGKRAADAPATLPAAIEQWASPMGTEAFDTEQPTVDVGWQVWQALELQHNQHYDAAITAWLRVEMPCETQVWKQVALGQAYLATGEIEDASEALLRAYDLHAGNPVVHYFLGLLRLEQAYVANEWLDAVGPRRAALVTFPPSFIVPNTKSMYQFAAAMELEEALRLAPDLWADEPLVANDGAARVALEPTVGDLLLAVGADKFEAKAHNMLSYLYLERDALEMAEEHMDAAALGGLPIIGYVDLAERYVELGQHTDAARAYLKAMKDSPDKVGPARKAWENLRQAWQELW